MIQEKIQTDLKKSMVEKDREKMTLLRTIIGEFNRIGKKIDDSKALKILKKMKDNAESVGNEKEISVIKNYIPEPLTEEKTIQVVDELIEKCHYTKNDFGNIMKDLKDAFETRIDMKFAASIIKKKFD